MRNDNYSRWILFWCCFLFINSIYAQELVAAPTNIKFLEKKVDELNNKYHLDDLIDEQIIANHNDIISSTLSVESNRHYRFPLSFNINSKYQLYDYILSLDNLTFFVADKISSKYPESQFISNSLLIIINTLQNVIIHEIAGHGFQVKDCGGNVNKFSILGFDIIQDSSIINTKSSILETATIWNLSNTDQEIQRYIAIDIAGINTNYKMSQILLRNHHLRNDELVAFYYLGGKLDFFFYNVATWLNLSSIRKNDDQGNDIYSYIKKMNIVFGENYMTHGGLLLTSMIDLLDCIYLLPYYDLPVIPHLKAIPTPYGLEYRIASIIIVNSDLELYVGLNIGSTKRLKSNIPKKFADYIADKGLIPPEAHTGAEFNDILETQPTIKVDFYSVNIISYFLNLEKHQIGINCAVWYQPELYQKEALLAQMSPGILLEVIYEYELYDFVSIGGELGFKTQGYLISYPYDASLMLTGRVIFKI